MKRLFAMGMALLLLPALAGLWLLLKKKKERGEE